VGPSKESNLTLLSCSPCNRSLLEAYSYRHSSLHSTRLNLTRPVPRRSAKPSRSHTHTDRFERTAVRILRLSAHPHPFLVYTFPLQSRTPAQVALLGDCFDVHLLHMLNQATVLDPLASPVSFSSLYFQLPLLSLTLFPSPCLITPTVPPTKERFGPFRLHRYLARNIGMSLASTSKLPALQWTRLLVSHAT